MNVSVREAVPLYVPVMVTRASEVTGFDTATKLAKELPLGTVRLEGTGRTVDVEVSATWTPPGGALPYKRT